ncbi:MAG: Crp/Fnr family transcriptional regulator [Bacteroidia bacterium]|nr:Crp/Fnr family transcriptional regulator [Bacteroidia bacterium]
MMIEEKLLISHGGVIKTLDKGDFIFHEGEAPRFYYQIKKGTVKMINVNCDGREFTQGVFEEGCSFGEPPLFINEVYPSSAVAATDTEVIKLNKKSFIDLLESNPHIQRNLLDVFARRIYNKAITSREVINNTPEQRILGFLKSYKKKSCNEDKKIRIPYTRQDIANFTGLRVETVIRTLSKMKDDNKVEIINRKLIY